MAHKTHTPRARSQFYIHIPLSNLVGLLMKKLLTRKKYAESRFKDPEQHRKQNMFGAKQA